MDGDRDVHELSIRERHAAGDLQAAADLVLRAYGVQIQRFLAARSRDRTCADEAYAEFEFDLWRGLAGFRWECSARVWVYTLARRAMIRCSQRARQRQRREVLRSQPGQNKACTVRTETRTALRTRSKQRIQELWRQLPEADQTLLLLRISRQLEWKEIACVMGASTDPQRALEVETARLRKRFQLVKAKLRKLADEDGLLAGRTVQTPSQDCDPC
ncbi:MAG TPA: hypothetical protein VFG30_42470 [Polyangiales bacterium]|nr:hypothetical protein [Polyangiales bacterium]